VNDQPVTFRGDESCGGRIHFGENLCARQTPLFASVATNSALLLPQTDAPQRSRVEQRIGIIFADVLRSIAISIDVRIDHGISTFPSDGDAMDQLVRIADETSLSTEARES